MSQIHHLLRNILIVNKIKNDSGIGLSELIIQDAVTLRRPPSGKRAVC
jgi:hypothetical protein